MLKYLIQLPCEMFGHNMLGFLELIDIIQFEKAAVSYISQQLLKSILPYSPPIVEKGFKWKQEAVNWINKRRCRVKYAVFHVESLCGVDIQHNIFDNVELHISYKKSLQYIEPLKNSYISERVSNVTIEGDQNPAVIEVLFSLLGNVRSLSIESTNLSQWMEHVKKIGPGLRELSISGNYALIKTITEFYCPYLEKLSLSYPSDVIDSNILQSIANNCPCLRSLEITGDFISDSDLTAFAEKCPQLEELSLQCQQLTDQSVIALAQHCSRLKKLELYQCKLTVASLIALSERGLPLEELDIPRIPILSAEIAAQCAHALSRIHQLSSSRYFDFETYLQYDIQYMTGLRKLELNNSKDHLLVPYLLLLLQGQCCAGLESLIISLYSSITPPQLNKIVSGCSNLYTI